jgi:FKBP-type peptidyl-prolyl cis-trans isomerase FkpA
MIKKSYYSFLLLLVTGLLIITSCNPANKYIKAENDATTAFLGSNPGFTKKTSGLYYMDVTVGTGIQPQTADTAYVWYTGKFLDGTVFDTNTNTGGTLLKFLVNENVMIAGFDEGITYMNVGGKAKLLIPSSLGYGPSGYYTIPGYTPLLYEVELVKIGKASK